MENQEQSSHSQQKSFRLQPQQNIQKRPKKSIFKKWWFWAIIVFVLVLIIGVSGGKKEKTKSEEIKKEVSTTKEEPTQEELDGKLKKKAIKADFVKVNGGEVKRGTDLYAEGTVNNLLLDPPMGKFLLSAKEGNGYGVYQIEYFTTLSTLSDIKIQEGDRVKVYGSYGDADGTRTESGIPIIFVTVIEKQK